MRQNGTFVHEAVLKIDLPIPSMNPTKSCLIEEISPAALLDLVISSLSYHTPSGLALIAPMPYEIRDVWDAGCLLVNIARMLKAFYLAGPSREDEREVAAAPKLKQRIIWNLIVVDEKLEALKEHVFDFFVD